VIRPFVYVREKSLRQFAESRELPVIPENCPACFEAPKVSKERCDDSMPVGRFISPHVNSLQAASEYIHRTPHNDDNKFHLKFTPVFFCQICYT
jgi:tRNA(Ile)-lysidine synthase TilS/MesJ